MHNDVFGTAVEVGDRVAFNPPRYKGLVIGHVIKFTPKGFTVEYRHQGQSVTTTVFDVAKRSYTPMRGEYDGNSHE
jgi:hypothetical protein